MEMFKGSTAKGQRVIGMYNSNIGFYLDDVYGSHSAAKDRAWRECMDWFTADNQSGNFHICSRSAHQFTVGWYYYDAETGHKIIRVETAAHTYRVDTEV